MRWLGHTMLAEVNLAVRPDLSVAQGHEIAVEARHQLMHHLQYLANATVHVCPVGSSGESSTTQLGRRPRHCGTATPVITRIRIPARRYSGISAAGLVASPARR